MVQGLGQGSVRCCKGFGRESTSLNIEDLLIFISAKIQVHSVVPLSGFRG